MTVSNYSLVKSAFAGAAATAMALVGAATGASAADWSSTELQFQYGKLTSPVPRAGKASTSIVTVQHASGYSFGDVFFFVDFLDDDKADGFDDKDAYGEGYAYFSSAKILKLSYGGPIKDVGFVMGLNYGADADALAYLPGGYVDWNAPGFAFLRTQATAYLQDSSTDGWQFDVSWAYPFKIAGQFFSLEGHAEYTDPGKAGKSWFMTQPQLRWDVGYALTGKKDQFFVGTEYQGWANKLGSDRDESAFQALGVWRF